MRWPPWNPDQIGMMTVIGAAVLIALGLAFATSYLPNPELSRRSAGFGPDWDCVAQVRGDPVCIKKAAR